MKKPLTTSLIFCLLPALLILTFSCKKNEKAANAGIVGKWVKAEFLGIQQYQFNSDNTVEYDVLATDSVTKAVIGYRYKSVGKYTVKKDSLTMFNLSNYSNPNNSFGPITDLVLINGPATITYSFSLNSQKNILSFYFNCPPYADCIPSPIVFSKE